MKWNRATRRMVSPEPVTPSTLRATSLSRAAPGIGTMAKVEGSCTIPAPWPRIHVASLMPPSGNAPPLRTEMCSVSGSLGGTLVSSITITSVGGVVQDAASRARKAETIVNRTAVRHYAN